MQRDKSIDIAKGLGIILVVVGHLSSPVANVVWLDVLRRFVYQFHIPLFFFISGMFVRSGEGWGTFLRKKVTRLYVPYIAANAIFLAVNVAAHLINGDEVVLMDTAKHMCKVALGLAVTPLGGATWFLATLFIAFILQKAIVGMSESLQREWLATVSIFLLGFVGMIVCPATAATRVLVAMTFMEAGRICMKFNALAKVSNPVAGVVALLLVIICACLNGVDMSQGQYGLIPLFIISSAAGIVMTYSFSARLAKSDKLISLLSFAGKRTMWILIGHFAAFKLVTASQMLIDNAPFERIFSHPCYKLHGAWPLGYLAAGVALPLLISLCRKSHS